jgi:hypothetical protein
MSFLGRLKGFECCGARKRSGSSALNSVATAPSGQVICRFDGS